jgi:hypothetical protein
MAGTDRADSTSDWLLLPDARDFAAQDTHSEKSASKLIEDCLQGRGHGPLRRRYASAEGQRAWGEPDGHNDAFYRANPERGVVVDFDYETSTVRRRTPPRYSRFAPNSDPVPTDWTLNHFQVHRGDLEAILQAMRLRPRPSLPQADKPLTSEREEKSKSISAPASKSASPKKFTAKGWVSSAVKDYPRPRGEKDYAGYLLKHAPQKWSKHSIQNALSELAKNPTRKKR